MFKHPGYDWRQRYSKAVRRIGPESPSAVSYLSRAVFPSGCLVIPKKGLADDTIGGIFMLKIKCFSAFSMINKSISFCR